ncbi:MAG: anhydro-N-acetylmuramic acid kinase, partial [Roseimicrobium sp.]
MTTRLLSTILCLATLSALAQDRPKPEKPTGHAPRAIEGWSVRVDERLLAPAHEELGRRAIALLTAKLADIRLLMAHDRVAALQRVAIVLDLTHGSLTSMQYHPSADWLVAHGYARELEKCVHIPVAETFASAQHNHVQPWCVLHELAHAYHDQVLGFDCGPGNVLMDLWCQQHLGQRHDHEGQWAATGVASKTLLNHFMQDPYFQAPPPKSTGRDVFHAAWLHAHLQAVPGLSNADVQATLAVLTAQTCAHEVLRHAPTAKRLLV